MKNCYRGYGRYNNYKSWYTIDGNLLTENVFADHNYCDIEDSFDRHGNVIGSHTVNHRSVEETRIMEYNNYWPIQIGYNFYLIDISSNGCSTIDDLNWMSKGLNNSNIGKFDVELYWYRDWDECFKLDLIPYECSFIGATREIIRKSFNDFISLNYLEYTEKYNTFIDTLEGGRRCSISQIYNTNIKIASYFYNVPEDKIITNNFNRPQKLIERLQKKINHKHSEQIKRQKFNQ